MDVRYQVRQPLAIGDRVEIKLPRYLQQQYKISARVLEGVVTEVSPRAFAVKGSASVRTPDYCGVCGREIDTPASRKLRIGKICAENHGVADLWHELNASIEADPARLEAFWAKLSHATEGEWSLPRGNVPLIVLERSGKPAVAYSTQVRKVELLGQDVFTFAWAWGDPDFDAIKSEVKGLGARWNPVQKRWELKVSLGNAKALHALIADFGFEADELATSVLDSWVDAQQTVAAPEKPHAKPEKPHAKPANPRQILFSGTRYIVTWPYNDRDFGAIKDTVKSIAGRRWDGVGKVWTLPQGSEGALLTLIEGYGFEADPAARDRIEQAVSVSAKRHEASSASNAVIDLNIPSTLALYPFQKAGVAYAVDVFQHGGKGAIIADDMGLGKTRQSIAAIEHLDLYPHIVVTTASAKGVWRREYGKVNPSRRVWVASSKRDVPPADVDVYVVNYDILADGWEPLKIGQKKYDRTARVSGLVENLFDKLPKSVTFDEIHKAKASSFSAGQKSQRSSACETISGYGSVQFTLGLTGTAIENRPSEIVQPLRIVGQLDNFGGPWEFAKRYFARRDGFRGSWDFGGAFNLNELNQRLREKCYIRRLKTDPKIGLELPPKTREIVDVELSGSGAYEAALWELENAQPEQRLGALSHLLAAVASEKVDAAVSWVKDFLEGSSDRKLIVFSKYQESQRALFDLCEPFGAVHILGADNGQARTWAEERFQSDPSVRVAVCSLKAASEALTLTAAADVLFLDLDWVPSRHDQAEDRAYRIGQNKPVTAYYLLADVDADTEQWQLLEEKRAVVKATLNGNADDAIVVKSAAAELLARLAATKKQEAKAA